MNHRWILFAAARHIRSRRRERGHTAGILAVGGIAAGVMTLIVVLAVMNGFQLGTIEDILEINSYHLRVQPEQADVASQEALLERVRSVRGVSAAIPFTEIHALARGFYAQPSGLLIRAVPDSTAQVDPGFAARLPITAGRFGLSEPGSVVVGDDLADRIGLRVGDEVFVVNFGDEAQNLMQPEEVSLTVTGIFHTGYLEFDAGWAFTSLQTAAERLGADAARIWGVKLDNRFADRRMASQIAAHDGIAEVESWRTYNRAIFGALRLEKTLMMLLVGLIFIVVGVNIHQSLRRSVAERTEEIGVLKALGGRPVALQLVFVFEGLMIGLSGGLLGTILGLLVAYNINAVFAFAERVLAAGADIIAWIVSVASPATQEAEPTDFRVFSPDYFYLDQVPTEVLLGELLGIFLFAVGSATVAAYVASRRVASIKPAEVLRYE